jgi:outer membrane protein insertion porin family
MTPPNRSRAPRRRAWLALALLVTATVGVPAGRAQELSGQIVRAIDVEGLKTLSEETLLYYLGLEVGKPVRQEELNRNIQSLWGRELIDDIKITSEPLDDGVKLNIQITERPILRSIDYKGLKKISQTDIRDKVVSERIGVREGTPLQYGELNRLKTLIEGMYRDKGYRFAEVTYKIEPVSGNDVRAVFTVDEGDRVRIENIDFEGNTVYSDFRLHLAMKKTKETGPLSRMLKHDIYNPATLAADLDKVKDLYKKQGYKNVLLGEPEVEVKAEHPDAESPKDQKRRIYLTIPLEEGERWKFGEITIEGNKVYSDQALLRVFRNKPGTWLRSNLIDDGVKSINDLYNNTGYMFARVESEIVEAKDNVANVVIHVDEGEQFKVGRMEFKGNTRTKDKVLRRELRVQEGFVMNVGALRSSVYKINQLGYFQLDKEDPVKIDVQADKKEVNLTFVGEEADRTELQFGGGWSEFDGFFGQFSIRTQNFLGRGETVSASFQSGKYRNLFDLSYFVPWFLDRPQTVGIRAFDSELDYGIFGTNDFVQKQKGGSLTYGRNLGLFQSASITYTLAALNDRQTLLIDNQPVTVAQDVTSSSLRPAWSYNSVDSQFEPTRGMRLNGSLEYAGGLLGGGYDFVRPEASFSLFKPLDKYPTHQVLGVNVEGGYIRPYGGSQLTVFEYYVLGGEQSIRGFARRSLFPRDDDGNLIRDSTGAVLGGDRYLQANLEYHILAGGPFRVILFGDAANTWAPGQSVDLGSLRYTAGLELRILVPVFGAPLRFIYAFNLNPKPYDQFENFQFTIGSSF